MLKAKLNAPAALNSPNTVLQSPNARINAAGPLRGPMVQGPNGMLKAGQAPLMNGPNRMLQSGNARLSAPGQTVRLNGPAMPVQLQVAARGVANLKAGRAQLNNGYGYDSYCDPYDSYCDSYSSGY
jgi:hypothetical protein